MFDRRQTGRSMTVPSLGTETVTAMPAQRATSVSSPRYLLRCSVSELVARLVILFPRLLYVIENLLS